MLGGYKFVIQGGLKPVYRRSRFDWREGLLSGPAWAGVLAVISARRAALQAWLGEGAARGVALGVLAAGLGVQAGTSLFGAAAPAAPIAQTAAKVDTNTSYTSSMRATGGNGLAADSSRLSESDGELLARGGTVLAASQPAPLGAWGGQGWNLPTPGLGTAPAPDGRIELLSNVGVYAFSGAEASNSGSGGSRNGGSEPSPRSDSSQPGSPSYSTASGSPTSGSSESPPANAILGAGDPSRLQAGLPVAVLAGRAGSGSVDIAPRSTRLFENLVGAGRGFHGQGQVGGGSAISAAASLSGGLSGGLYAARSGGVSKAFSVAGLVGGRSGGPGAIPEPSTWVIMLLGFALAGGSARQRRGRAGRVSTGPSEG